MTSTPVSGRGYARPELLAETGWLAGHLTDPDLRIIDTRSPQLYEAGHIPGAVNLAAVGAIPRAPDGDMGSAEDFAALAGALGVGNDSRVVVYDAPAAAMGMLAWAFLYYGHHDVSMLDGGFYRWTAEGHAVSTEPSSYAPARFEARLAEEIYCSLDHARAAFGGPNTVFWDTRTPAEFEGTAPTGPNAPARTGHLPGAAHLEWTELLDPDTRLLKPAAELRALLDSRGITPESEINCY
jgi:thiosulfate/3-mercaptopyruvate sulfurtransferase